MSSSADTPQRALKESVWGKGSGDEGVCEGVCVCVCVCVCIHIYIYIGDGEFFAGDSLKGLKAYGKLPLVPNTRVFTAKGPGQIGGQGCPQGTNPQSCLAI